MQLTCLNTISKPKFRHFRFMCIIMTYTLHCWYSVSGLDSFFLPKFLLLKPPIMLLVATNTYFQLQITTRSSFQILPYKQQQQKGIGLSKNILISCINSILIAIKIYDQYFLIPVQEYIYFQNALPSPAV